MSQRELFLRLGAGVLALGLLAGPLAAQEDHDGHGHDDHEEIEDFATDASPFERTIDKMCRFTHECYEGEGCIDTFYEPELRARAGGSDMAAMFVEGMLISDAGDVPLLGVVEDDAMSLSGGAVQARHMLTIAPSGDARYTVHLMEGPVMISYYGRCE